MVALRAHLLTRAGKVRMHYCVINIRDELTAGISGCFPSHSVISGSVSAAIGRAKTFDDTAESQTVDILLERNN